ncbi:glutathione S-transferase U10-like [Humulus lupulus]|uniref:glutathione S-transferase U10-like n=1 Tax=Humulus lupulus TaxID=3486 RepID=UPI002B404F84|nr:glutathione S-transferase U10-like [Humulus lupulus]
MESDDEVIVFGTWASAFSGRVEIALKLKGIPYKYVQEDLANKSEMLLHYNPVHKKVPVLVHKGSPISESLVILQYIDEFWSTNNYTNLLPKDPYERALIRFWANFYDHKIISAIYTICESKIGNEREKAVEELSELLKIFEEGIQRDFPRKLPFFDNENNVSFLGIVVNSYACVYPAFHETVAVIISPEKNPTFLSWVNALRENPLVKDTLPDHHRLVRSLNAYQARLSSSS